MVVKVVELERYSYDAKLCRVIAQFQIFVCRSRGFSSIPTNQRFPKRDVLLSDSIRAWQGVWSKVQGLGKLVVKFNWR